MARLTPEVVDQIEEYAERGKSGLWIARKLDLPPATVNYRMLRAGFDPWPGTRSNKEQAGAFSPEEDEQLLDLGRQGLGWRKIAEMMKRPRTSVRIRLMTLEVRAEKALEAA